MTLAVFGWLATPNPKQGGYNRLFSLGFSAAKAYQVWQGAFAWVEWCGSFIWHCG